MADKQGQPKIEQQSFIPEQAPVPEQQPAPEAPEVSLETPTQAPRVEQEPIESRIDTLRTKLRKPKKQKPPKVPQVRDTLTIQVETIMEEGLSDAFSEMTPVEQQEFKIAGERAAFEIRDLLRASHVKVKKIFKLLVDFLKKLPGVNRFYLIQEAKIKTDKIVTLSQQNNHQG